MVDQFWSDYFLLNMIDTASKNSGCLHERGSWSVSIVRIKQYKYVKYQQERSQIFA